MITRNNYEEFFILYWDNELDPSQRRTVEDFVKEHTDLEEEFRLLGSTRFMPENEVTYDGKELLIKPLIPVIDKANYENYLLSYIDQELNQPEKLALEKYLQLNPAARDELRLLEKTKLQPEFSIVFPDKSSLYRKEPAKIITIFWLRIAAAAAILLVAGFYTIRMIDGSNNNNGETPVVKIEERKTSPKINPGDNNIDEINNKSLTSKNNEAISSDDTKKDVLAIKGVSNKKAQVPVNKKESRVIDKNDAGSYASDFAIELPNKTDAIVSNPIFASNNPLNNNDVTKRATPALDIPETVMNPGNEEEVVAKDNGGLRGFLRKATRVIERRTNIKATTEDDKLLVGAFAVSLK